VTTDDDDSVSSEAAHADATLAAAVRIAALLESMGVESAVIGAIALAVHGYARATEDVDLGIAVADPFLLGKLGNESRPSSDSRLNTRAPTISMRLAACSR
jgi:hypothetical protein